MFDQDNHKYIHEDASYSKSLHKLHHDYGGMSGLMRSLGTNFKVSSTMFTLKNGIEGSKQDVENRMKL